MTTEHPTTRRSIPDLALVLRSMFQNIGLRRDWDHRRSMTTGQWVAVSHPLCGWQMNLGMSKLLIHEHRDGTWLMWMVDQYETFDPEMGATLRDIGHPSTVSEDLAKSLAVSHGLRWLETRSSNAMVDAAILRECVGDHQL